MTVIKVEYEKDSLLCYCLRFVAGTLIFIIKCQFSRILDFIASSKPVSLYRSFSLHTWIRLVKCRKVLNSGNVLAFPKHVYLTHRQLYL